MNNYEKEDSRVTNRKITLDDSINLLNKQDREIARLKSELTAVLNERDLLLCEVSKLKFELEIVDLKRIHDDRIPCLKGKDLLHGSVNSSQDCEEDLEPRDDGNAIDDDVDHYVDHRLKHHHNSSGGSDLSSAAFICHMWHNNNNNNNSSSDNSSGKNAHKKKGSICSANDNNVKHFRITQNGYELSQDLLDKQIELLERKYGGVKARKAAVTIQRAFRRYMLLKKFTHITAMAKAEKRLSRRFQTYSSDEQHHSGVVISNGGPPPMTAGRNIGPPDYSIMSAAAHHGDIMQNVCCQSAVAVGNLMMTPVRSLSMREKRMAELENGTNSLPRMYSNAHCNGYASGGSSNYCCNMVTTACSHMCSSVYPDMYPNVELQEHNNSRLELPRKSKCYTCIPPSSSPPPISSSPFSSQMQNYHQMPSACSSTATHTTTTKRIVHQQQVSISHSSHSQMSTPVKKVPPEVPKRTSSISLRSVEGNQNNNSSICSNSSSNDMSFGKTHYSGSMSSVQSSSSGDSSNAATNAYNNSFNSSQTYTSNPDWNKKIQQISETLRKRQYRVGLNLFNKKPEKGVAYLMRKGFLENSPQAVAKFMIARKGLSKQMIGEYLGNVQDSFNSAVLECFVHELDLSGMQVDVALRKFQTYFRMPGEAQKIERLMEVFSHRYCQCNRDVVSKLRTLDTVFVLAFAIIMLNTDLHTPNLKAERRMKLQDFIKNLRGVDDCCDIDHDMLVGIYERIKANEFKPGSDHVSQVMKVQSTIIGKKPNLAVSHRRLVCYCRLYEVPDVNKKDKPGLHQREVFLFNDLLVITKILSKKKNSVTYTFRQSFSLSGLNITTFQTSHYLYGIRLAQRVDNRVLITFNARNEHDRSKFVDDIRESILEMDEMENIRIESELERQKNGRSNRCNGGPNGNENRDSGVADVEVCPCLQSSTPIQSNKESPSKSCAVIEQNGVANSGGGNGLLKRSGLSNSLIDIHDQDYRPKRNGSVGSLDSGMSISFASSNKVKDVSSSRKPPVTAINNNTTSNNNTSSKTHLQPPSFLAGIFNKR